MDGRRHEPWRPTTGCGGMSEVFVSIDHVQPTLTADARWTNQRIAFGKPLNSQAVIRAHLASMIERVEACQSWVENITYQMNHVRLQSIFTVIIQRANSNTYNRCHMQNSRTSLLARSPS